jgi:hypothetical protein
MGAFLELVKKLLNFMSEIISRVLNWFVDVREEVEHNTSEFLMYNKPKILASDNPIKVGKIAGQQKAIRELERITEEEKKDLSASDLDTIESMFSNENFNF